MFNKTPLIRNHFVKIKKKSLIKLFDQKIKYVKVNDPGEKNMFIENAIIDHMTIHVFVILLTRVTILRFKNCFDLASL